MFTNRFYDSALIAIEEGGDTLYAADVDELTAKISTYTDYKPIVFCLCSNTVGALAGYISFIKNGWVPVMLDARKDICMLQNLIVCYHPMYIWEPSAIIQSLDGYSNMFSYKNYTLLRRDGGTYNIYKDLALLLTTSGSTGSPKLVRLSYKNLQSNAESIAEYLNITSEERPITSLPMYYSYGLSVINSHLIKGATILLTDKSIIQKEFWDFAKNQKATSMAGVPYTYEVLRRLRIFKMDLPYLKTMTQAGGKLASNITEEYIRNAVDNGKRFFVMYGQTEATARMSYLPQDRAMEKYASIGIAIPDGCFSLIDADGNEFVEPNVDGELVYRGPNVSLGYAESVEDLAKGDENGGVLYTGDIARRDEDGFYYITGRMKRFVKIFGNRVNLDAIEQLVKAVTTSCACVGIDDKLTVFTTAKGKEEEIISLLVKKTGLNIRAFAVRVIDVIPKNTSGKIQYVELSNLLEN